MRLAITGITGNIGRGYLNSLSNKDEVKALVRKGGYTTFKKIEPFSFDDDLKYATSFLNDFVKDSVVVHCAALLNSDLYNLEEVIAVNAMLTGALAIATMHTGAPKMIYISTEMIYELKNEHELNSLRSRFVEFCQEYLTHNGKLYDLRMLAQAFIQQNSQFPFGEYNGYALSKYLGEAIINSMPNSATLRITNAYGPGYDNPRLIPRMIQGRLIGHNIIYPKEKRDFVYSNDINTLINTIIEKDLRETFDCKSDETIETQDLADMIIHATPTAYGELTAASISKRQRPEYPVLPAISALTDIIKPTPFKDGFSATLRWHKEQTYHQMKDGRSLQDFLKPGEQIIQTLKGSSTAHLCIVAGTDRVKKVRKVAIYDGVEGNGIAKVANEIKYYQYISKHKPKLASMYPRLVDAKTDETFSSETIEYLDGKNFYQSIKDGDLPINEYRDSVVRFIGCLSDSVLKNCKPAINPYGNLDAYYVERSFSRLRPIEEVLTVQDVITINDVQYTAPHLILSDLLKNERLRDLLKPRIEAFCFHGDLTFLNTVFERKTQNIRLIDPRGHIGNWDPLYDYAKLAFTLGGFGEFVISKEPMVAMKSQGNFVVHFEQIPQISRQLHSEFLNLLAHNQIFRTNVISREPYWQQRIAFAAATHFLADIPFRLYTDNTTATALASYIIGTYYLNKVYEGLKDEVIS
ncbi:MAG TPA: NAD-dependent epimerase/dehydratase family protein [Candidatus Saccharimonas sp.]|nr:NAD-dependent epimerase/dehydratase family protein [Candidatus Saccharimonas sp.]